VFVLGNTRNPFHHVAASWFLLQAVFVGSVSTVITYVTNNTDTITANKIGDTTARSRNVCASLAIPNNPIKFDSKTAHYGDLILPATANILRYLCKVSYILGRIQQNNFWIDFHKSLQYQTSRKSALIYVDRWTERRTDRRTKRNRTFLQLILRRRKRCFAITGFCSVLYITCTHIQRNKSLGWTCWFHLQDEIE
jgi:hypothetical protein